jgi:TRAP-type C4-dicarboxylate transport system permease small subunit
LSRSASSEPEAARAHPLRRLLTVVASAFLGCAVVLMSMQVILRFGFNAPQAWAEEVDRYLFVWSVYLGATLALMKGTHIRVTFAVDRFGAVGEAVSQWLTRIIGAAAFGFTAWYGFLLAWGNRTSEFYTVPGMPQILFYLAAPVGLGMMSLYLLVLIFRDLVPASRSRDRSSGDA